MKTQEEIRNLIDAIRTVTKELNYVIDPKNSKDRVVIAMLLLPLMPAIDEFMRVLKEDVEEIKEAELVEEDVDPGKKEYCELQIVHASESWDIKKQTRDKRLESEHILSYLDLANAFFLLRIKSLQKSKSIRDAVLEKYTEVVQFVNLEDNENSRRNS